MEPTDNPHSIMLWLFGWLFITMVAVLLTFALVFVPAIQRPVGAALPYLKAAALVVTVYHVLKFAGFRWTRPKT